MALGIVPDMTVPGAFNEVVKSTPPFSTVLHQASPFFFSSITNNEEFLDPAIKGTTEILKEVKAYAHKVKRAVYTPSFAAVLNLDDGISSTPKRCTQRRTGTPSPMKPL
jgi:hypothetical protein